MLSIIAVKMLNKGRVMLKSAHYYWKKLPKSVVAILLILLLFILAIFFRINASLNLKKQTKNNELPFVSVITVKADQGTELLVLPGNVRAWHEATIYARTNGYIKKWYVDIGHEVKKDQLLAEIETPELDAQLRQAEADLNTAYANNKLAQITAKRWVNLLKSDSVSKQEADEKINTAAAQQALVDAAQANVSRLQELVNFEKVIAPFAGVITARHTDVGSLITQGSTGNVPLFEIAQINPLRVYVEVPQNYASFITPSMNVTLRFTEYPGKDFSAQLIQTAKAINPTTRTLLAQFQVNNDKGLLLAGGYTEVRLSLPLKNSVRIPANTLLFQAAGMQVVVLNEDNRVHLKPVTISRDFGDSVEIKSGLKPGERILVYPPDSIVDGEKVRVAP